MVRKLLLCVTVLFASATIWAQALTINESAGWLESAYVKWQPVTGAESYNVYYSGEGIADKKIDDQLIRSYGTYFRADVLGLKAGTYTIKVVPVVAGVEGESATTASLTVLSHDRAGFAFSGGRVPGAYNADGTPKAGAVVIYITQNTKNTVSMTVNGATTNPCVGFQTILDGFKKGIDTRPLIVRMVGQITDLDYMLGGDIVIENKNNASSYITLEGVGEDAVADGWGIRLKYATNVEIRNIGTMNCNSSEGDNIGLQQDNDHIWIHHCDFFYGEPGGDPDQAKGDGALDSKTSGFVTFSYNHFWDSGKCNLLGNGTEPAEYLTYHHNWYDHSDSRHPRVRSHSAHVYNNYYDGNSKYGIGSTMASSVFVESNYFRNCKYPILTSMQGTDIYDGSSIFSNEDGGSIKAFNNYMTGQSRFVAYNNPAYTNSTVEFDAVVVENRTDEVSSSITSKAGSNIYNNFDTNSSVMYTYSPDSPDNAKANVIKYAGRVNGGDLKYTFNNAVDDISYNVNTALKAALTGYQTTVVAIQGDGAPTGGGGGGGTGDSGTVKPGDEVHNFTLAGTTSTFYTITGSLSTTKGTVTYNNLTLTQCLKMESSTSVAFTTTKESTLTLVFNNTFVGKILIDGTAYNPTAGILTVTISAGTHKITKGDTSNLFYMSIAYPISTAVKSNILGDLILYPNPVATTLTVLSEAKVLKVEIYNIVGVLALSTSGNSTDINVGHLPHGTYLVVVTTENATTKHTIIKK